MKRLRLPAAAVMSFAIAAGALAAPAAPAPEVTALELDLHGAVFQGARPEGTPRPLMLSLTQDGPWWLPVAGMAQTNNKALHWGRVLDGKVADDAVALTLAMHIRSDPYVAGGRARYEVTLKRGPDGTLAGVFTGTYKGVPVSGKAEGRIGRRQPLPGAREPAARGEHPRILLRKADLPALREKARTPFGRAALEKMADAIGLGLRYQVTGDAALAEEARRAVAEHMANQDGGHGAGRRAWGPRLEQIAVTYDLCCDAWPADFRREVQDYMVMIADRICNTRREWASGEFSWSLLKHGGRVYTGIGFMGLALWGEPSPEPERPPEPFADRPPEPEVAPAAQYRPGQGVPVVRFADDAMPNEWIYVGGFKPGKGEDPLAALGGAAKARPEVGTEAAHGGRTERFRPLSREKDQGYWEGRIDVTSAIGRVYFSTSYFYTVIDNDKPRWVQVLTEHGGADVYLAGVLRRDGDFARLDKGLYPMLVAVSILDTRPWGRICMRPRLKAAPDAYRKAHLAALGEEHQARLKDWEADAEQWKRAGGADQRFTQIFLQSRMTVYQYLRECLQAGGFPRAMSYDGTTDALVARYLAGYRTMFGEDVSPLADVTPTVLAYLQGRIPPLDPSSRADQRGMGEPGPGIHAPLFALVPPREKPAMLPFWNRAAGVADAASAVKALDGDPVFAFLHYPLQGEATPPADRPPAPPKAE